MHIIQSDKVDGLINHYNWLISFLPQYNKDNESSVTISPLSQHYEHRENYKELMSRDEFDSWKASKHYDPNRIQGETIIFYRATFEVTANSRREWVWLNTDHPNDYPENGATYITSDLDEKEKKYEMIQTYKFLKSLETRLKVSYMDVPDPTDEELEAYKLEKQKEKDEELKNIRESWK